MKTRKTLRLISLVAAILLLVPALFACTNGSDKDNTTTSATVSESTEASSASTEDSDSLYVKDKGELVIGITYFAPMDYFDEDGTTLIGFDHDLAAAVAEKLGVAPKFQLINWSTKETELASKAIDCIWNGMTVDADRAENMNLTANYMINRQVLVVKASRLDEFTSIADMAEMSGAAEAGSAGEDVINSYPELAAGLASVEDQANALLEVKAGTADYCVIDSVMAEYLLASDSDFSELSTVEAITLSDDEFYAAAFRKGSDLRDEVNDILAELWADGTIGSIAEKYGVTGALVEIA